MNCRECLAYCVCGVTTDPGGTACQKFQMESNHVVIIPSGIDLKEAEEVMRSNNVTEPVREAVRKYFKERVLI